MIPADISSLKKMMKARGVKGTNPTSSVHSGTIGATTPA
jgi:hypothetical protein